MINGGDFEIMMRDMVGRMNRHERRKRRLDEQKIEEILSKHADWVDRETKKLLPAWAFNFAIKHKSRLIGRLFGISIRLYKEMGTMNWKTEILKWGKPIVARTISIDIQFEERYL